MRALEPRTYSMRHRARRAGVKDLAGAHMSTSTTGVSTAVKATHNACTPGNWLEHIAITVMGSASLHRVRVAGELDVATAGILRGVLVQARGRDVVVDVSGLSFIDALGVSTLILGYRDATRAGRSFVVQGARGTVRRVLELAEVDRLLAHGVAVG